MTSEESRPMTEPDAWHYADGELALAGELFHPVGPANGRAVLVVHEADGIGGNVRRHCRMLAEQGYLAAAADMHGRGGPLTAEEIPPALAAFLGDRDVLRRRVRAALDAVKRDHGLGDGDCAAIGYCFGGTAVLELARDGVALAAVASFHGLLGTNMPAAPGAVAARVLACTGARDPLVPPDDIAAFQAEMARAGADWQLCVFGRALHSFTNRDVDALGDARMGFDAQAERLSWTMLLEFLAQSFGLVEQNEASCV
jgi:dienelactone hydrolase